MLELGILLGSFQRRPFCGSDSSNHTDTHPLCGGGDPLGAVVVLWCHLPRSSAAAASALTGGRLSPRCPVFRGMVKAEFAGCSAMPRTHLLPEALWSCSRTGARLRIPFSLPGASVAGTRRHMSESAVSSSGAWDERIVTPRFRTPALGFLSPNDFYKRSLFEEAIILNAARLFFSLPAPVQVNFCGCSNSRF